MERAVWPFCFFGDGASNAGPFHESINIAANWKLPVIYVCENNLWAVNVPATDSVPVDDIAECAKGYGIPGVVVDGNDIFAVHNAASHAVERARRGDGPSLIECKTYRHRRHTERADQPDSRSSEELAFWKSRDPIEHVRRHLLTSSDPLSDADWQEIDRQVLADIEASVVFAKASPVPQLDAALDDVFAE